MIVQGYYRHFKGGIYQVIGVALNSETLEEKVIYRSIDDQLWERPVTMWKEKVNGVPRFELYSDKHEGRLRFMLAQHAYREKLKNRI